MQDANTKEIDPDCANPIVVEMLEYTPEQMGGTMRLGSKKTVFKAGNNSKIWQLYGSPESIYERHRHRYEINAKYVDRLEAAGMRFVGVDDQNERMEVMELDGHPYFVAVQFHPEYTSRPLNPSPPFVGLILAAKGKLQSYLQNNCRFSPRDAGSDSSSTEDLNLVNEGLDDKQLTNGSFQSIGANGDHLHRNHGQHLHQPDSDTDSLESQLLLSKLD